MEGIRGYAAQRVRRSGKAWNENLESRTGRPRSTGRAFGPQPSDYKVERSQGLPKASYPRSHGVYYGKNPGAVKRV